MTLPEKRVEQLIDLIYDAAEDHDLWRAVLTEIADLTGSSGGVLYGQSMLSDAIHFDFQARMSEEGDRVYKQRHVRNNPWVQAMMSQPVGRVVLSDAAVPIASLKRSAFYDEVLRPQGIAHNSMIALAAKDRFRAAFSLCRSERQGLLPEGGQRLLDLLMPHMCRSVRLGFRIDAFGALRHEQYAVLDHLAMGLILLNRRSRIVYANPAARRLDTPDGPLRLRDGAVAVSNGLLTQRLNTLVDMAARGLAPAAMSVPRPTDIGLLTILVSPVRGRAVGRFADLSMPDAAVLMLVVDPANQSGVPVQWIVDAFGLTPAEAKVAICAGSGMTLREVARALDVSTNTVKTHLRRIYVKTGTGRLAEIARLLASIELLAPHQQQK